MSAGRTHPTLGDLVAATEVATSGLSPRRTRIIILLLAGSVGLMMTGFGIIWPIFAKRLGEFDSGVGSMALMTMAFALAQLVAAPFMGSLADRYGRRPMVLFSLAAFAGANVGFLFAPSTEVLVAVRALEGGLTAGLMPAAMGVVGDIVPEDRRARWVGIVMGSMGAGFIFGPVIGGVLFEAWGFEAPFIASAALALGAFIAATILVPETRTREIRRRDELGQRRTAAESGQKTSVWAALPRPLRVFGTLLAIDFLLMFTFSFIEPQMVFYFYDDLGFSPIRFGLVVGTYGLAMVVGQMALGQASDRLGRTPVIVAGIALFSTFFFALAFLTWYPFMFLGAATAGLGNALIMPAASAFYLDITSERHRSRVMGIKESAVSLGGVLGPLTLTGASVLLTPRGVFMAAGVVSVVAAVLALVLLREPRRVTETIRDVAWVSSSKRAMAAQASLRGVVLMARRARERGDTG